MTSLALRRDDEHRYWLGTEELWGVSHVLRDNRLVDDKWYDETSRSRGTAIHSVLAGVARGLTFDPDLLDPDLAGWVKSGVDFLTTIKADGAEILAAETMRYHSLYKFAGEIDLLCRQNGRMVIYDFKSGKAAKVARFQLAAYSLLVPLEPTGIPCKKAVVELQKDGSRAKLVEFNGPAFFHDSNRFLSFLNTTRDRREFAPAVLFEPAGMLGHIAPSRRAGEKIACPITCGASSGGGPRIDADAADNLIPIRPDVAGTLGANHGNIKAEDAWGGKLIVPPAVVYENHGQDSRVKECEVSPQINAKAGTGGGNLPLAITPAPQIFKPSHDADKGDQDPIIFETRYARNGRGAPDTVCPPLKAQSGETGKGDAGLVVAFTQNSRSEVREIGGDGQIVGALAAQPGAQQQNYIGGRTAVRRLTPVECEKLQGFPPGYTDIPWKGKTAPDGPRYRALGNSMAVPVMAWIGKRIQEVDDTIKGR